MQGSRRKYATVLLRSTVAGAGLESMRSCSGEEVSMKVCAEEGWTRKYVLLRWSRATVLEVCAGQHNRLARCVLLERSILLQHKYSVWNISVTGKVGGSM